MSEAELSTVAAREREVVGARARRFRPDHAALSLEGKIAIIVDDGIATGSTAHAACGVARAAGAAVVVLAVPVAPADCHPEHWPEVDEFVCLQQPHRFYAVGQFYDDFGQTTDDEVVALLKLAAASVPAEGSELGRAQGDETVRHIAPENPAVDEDVDIPIAGTALQGRVTLPAGATGIVLFAHGSGSSRHSPRNRYVATVLQEGGLGTLLFDLLTTAEEAHRSNVFDIDLLAERLVTVTDWVVRQPWGARLQVGYFGASTGAAAALAAAAVRTRQIAAVVSRGGRPDLAMPVLDKVTAPTLLIVGGWDEMVLELNRRAQRQLRCENDLAVVPGATHLFEEPGTLAQAARLARDWFVGHLARQGSMTA
jgi:putative phosphoribosyl transferase